MCHVALAKLGIEDRLVSEDTRSSFDMREEGEVEVVAGVPAMMGRDLGSQKATSRGAAGYLLKGWKRFKGFFSSNCSRKRGSLLQKSLMSGIPKSNIAILSNPRPNAQPTRFGTPARIRSG